MEQDRRRLSKSALGERQDISQSKPSLRHFMKTAVDAVSEVREATQRPHLLRKVLSRKTFSHKNEKQKSIKAKSLAKFYLRKIISRIIPLCQKEIHRTDQNYNLLSQKKLKYIKKMIEDMK